MQETTIICDCCGTEIDESPAEELSGELGENRKIELDDICTGCCDDIWEAIESIKIRRSQP